MSFPSSPALLLLSAFDGLRAVLASLDKVSLPLLGSLSCASPACPGGNSVAGVCADGTGVLLRSRQCSLLRSSCSDTACVENACLVSVCVRGCQCVCAGTLKELRELCAEGMGVLLRSHQCSLLRSSCSNTVYVRVGALFVGVCNRTGRCGGVGVCVHGC